MTFKRKEKGKKLKTGLIIFLCLGIILPAIGILIIKLEGEKPSVELNLLSTNFPASSDITGYATDQKSGVKKLWIGLLKDGKETILLENEFESHGIIPKDTHRRVPFKISINSKELKISDGIAKVRVAVWDHSWRDWFKGNRTYVEKEIIFDTKPPVLSILSTQHNVTLGGSGLVIYKLSEQCKQSGVFVGESFFPGYAGHFKERDIYLAFFAIPYDFNKKSDFFVKAVDLAGNSVRSGFYHHIRNRKFKSDTINISENFLNLKLPEFQVEDGFPADKSSEDRFIFINEELRKRNNHTILANGQKTEKQILWNDVFGRLPNSARKANFADHRVYMHNGKVVSKAVHMGIDLASVKHAEVPAASRGKVAFADYVGIYGNLVCIDHGLGLFSVYAHLSRINVNNADMVDKGDIVGFSGITGLAGGDHLHFGMFIDHVFVNPVEWWDATWIKNNITSKIDTVQSMVN